MALAQNTCHIFPCNLAVFWMIYEFMIFMLCWFLKDVFVFHFVYFVPATFLFDTIDTI